MILALSVLSGCDSGGGGKGGVPDSIGPINCAGLTGATATGSVACTAGECSVSFHDAAIDGDLGTYAILATGPNSAGSVRIRATAQDGVTYPAGTPAAVVYGIDRTGDSFNTAESITTYLDGTPQETGNLAPGNGVTNTDVEPGRRAMNTNLPFDAIELTYVQSGGTANVEVQVYEFCTSVN